MPDRDSRLPRRIKGRASHSARWRDRSVAAKAASRTRAATRPYWLTRTAQAPPTAAKVATPAKDAAMPASNGNPLLRKGCSARANTKGSTGRMHGLRIVSTPPRNASSARVMVGCRL